MVIPFMNSILSEIMSCLSIVKMQGLEPVMHDIAPNCEDDIAERIPSLQIMMIDCAMVNEYVHVTFGRLD